MAERTRRRSSAVVAVSLLLPVAGLVVLLSRPMLDVHWEHHPSHFWLVLGTAGVSAVLAYATGAAAEQRGDARVLFVSLALLSSAGFLALHALATPGVLLADPNPGFVVATPVGIALGSILAAWSTVNFAGDRAVRAVVLGRRLRTGLFAIMAIWAFLSLGRLPPFDVPPAAGERLLWPLALPAIGLYAFTAVRCFRLWRRHGAPLVLAVMSACVLLAEAMAAIAVARNWHLSWWEWHVLLLAAYSLVAVVARRSWHEERFAELYLSDTVSGHREMSVLFADLQGFTTYSEAHRPEEVTTMLNLYFADAVPAVVAHGGDVDRIIGDALMVTFNKRGDQPDHAVRAARAGLALQDAASSIADAHPGWPRFRVGINTGPVNVSLLGTGGGRTHTVIGDTVNTASRIEGRAPAGGVALGSRTRDQLPHARTRSLGPLDLKGKAEPVEAHLLISLDD
jgi:adenylate cyclase